jgi:hypothetical protein
MDADGKSVAIRRQSEAEGAKKAPPFNCSPCFRNSRNLLTAETLSREEVKGEEKKIVQKQRLNKT